MDRSTAPHSPHIDYTMWDWLPDAAAELEAYLQRLLDESEITPHAINARQKTITSFIEKASRPGKDYSDPQHNITDIIAARIITYSSPDKEAVIDLLRDRFVVKEGEDWNPGDERREEQRGYDCHHLIVTSERQDLGWLRANGPLAQYFKQCRGLELQVRTVAAHAWAEFEHEHRYKSVAYNALKEQSPEMIHALDGLFAAASDSRRALDEVFAQIKTLLDHPPILDASSDDSEERIENLAPREMPSTDSTPSPTISSIDLRTFLSIHYPDDGRPSHAGLDFADDLLTEVGITSIKQLEETLKRIDSDEVRNLMSFETPVTSVRRLDDDLLALFGEEYISKTAHLGIYSSRERQLQLRFNRLRGKLKYKIYSINGADAPENFRDQEYSAVRTVRILARLIADRLGPESVIIAHDISASDDLLPSTRSKELSLSDNSSIWVSTNIGREHSEELIRELLKRATENELDLTVTKRGESLSSENLDEN